MENRPLMLILLFLSALLGSLAGSAISPDVAAAQSRTPLLTQRSGAQQPENVLSVTGEGTQMIPTTLSEVSLAVVVQAQTAQDAQQQAAQRQTAVIEWLRSQSVENLETTNISLNPRYDYRDDERRLIGYEATNTLSFRIANEATGDVIDGAIAAGASRINGISFVAEDGAITAARQRALESAVADAQQQADTVLAALGLSRQSVVNIEIGAVSAPPPVTVSARAELAEAADVSTPVVGRSQSITAQVTLHIRY